MIYKGAKTKNISFPLGGIGSGSIGLAGNGALMDWEIFNKPNKNSLNGYSHFAVKAKANGKTDTRVLMGDTNESLMGMHDSAKHGGFGYGPHSNSMAGYPHFRNVSFNGSFPVAELTFTDDDFPMSVRMTAFNPLIPHDSFNSSIPAAFFEIELENLTDGEMEGSVALSVANPVRDTANKEISEDGCKGVFFDSPSDGTDSKGHCDMSIVTSAEDARVQAFWYRGRFQDSPTVFWKNYSSCDRLEPRSYDSVGRRDHGTVAAYVSLRAKEKRSVRFVISWNVPNSHNYWNPYKDENGNDVTWKNYYATVFSDSKESALYSLKNFDDLWKKTKAFSDAIDSCSLPCEVKDAISANLSVLKSPTVLRLEDGSFWAWEGCSEAIGSCEGSCQHVWNYAYALPFLFPDLERTMRENTIKYALKESGATVFRVPLPLGRDLGDHRPCVDGQMGEVIKCYREWRISGDDGWIKKHAPAIFKMLDYAWSPENYDRWDADKDGILEGRQHHTLDVELFGPSSWLEGFYLLALDCASEIADAVGDFERAKSYRELYKKGKQKANELLFNGSYFVHRVDIADKSIVDSFNAEDYYWNAEANEIKYQIVDGCEIDQVLADWHAAIIGKSCVFDDDKRVSALKSIYKNNYKTSMRSITNMWRNFSLDDEAGTLICSYPDGASVPTIPIPYCEETMTGFEYAFGGTMIANGLVEEGEKVVKAIRDRHDGEKRNPWNEFECGSNYARSMASFALMPIYSGFSFDMREGYIGFSPVKGENGSFLWSVGESWGTVGVSENAHTLSVKGEPITLSSYGIKNADAVTSVTADGLTVDFCIKQGRVTFGSDVTVRDTLTVKKK